MPHRVTFDSVGDHTDVPDLLIESLPADTKTGVGILNAVRAYVTGRDERGVQLTDPRDLTVSIDPKTNSGGLHYGHRPYRPAGSFVYAEVAAR
jgi:hypothetical protein